MKMAIDETYAPSTPNNRASQQTKPSSVTTAPPLESLLPTVTICHLTVIYNLQNILSLLAVDAQPIDLAKACEMLHILDSEGHKCVFKMSGSDASTIADRPFYHLYFIHKNETPEHLNDDIRYGNKAFVGEFPATNEERLRSIQRSIVELVLEKLEDAINFADETSLAKLLDILESIKLNAKDRAEGQENAAYNLFSAFYHLHVGARTKDSTLIDPQEPQFHADFGRNAFYTSSTGIDPTIKLAAIDQVRTALNKAWKLQ
jgi:hypothetical protein